MDACCDTSFLYALYGDDAHTTAAREQLAHLHRPLSLSPFNEFELTNAILHASWRRLITSETAEERLAAFRQDRESGLFIVEALDPTNVLQRALAIARERTRTEGHRSFDILHVAAALELGADVFLTFDVRQCELATAEGLRTEIPALPPER